MKTYTALLLKVDGSDFRLIEDIKAETDEDALYFAEEIALPDEEVQEIRTSY